MPNPLAGRSILVVAEEPFLAYCLQVLLKAAGAHVIETNSARGVFSLIERQHPSAVVLHSGSASKVAKQVAQRLTQLGVPCIVCTGDARGDQKVKGSFVLPKPVRGTELIEMLSRLTLATRHPSAGPPPRLTPL